MTTIRKMTHGIKDHHPRRDNAYIIARDRAVSNGSSLRRYSYILVSPCKDEGKHLEEVIKAVVAQDVKPRVWMIVNDGSTDNSLDIIKRYSAKFPWIIHISLSNEQRDLNFRYSFVCKSGFENAIAYCKKNDATYEFIGLLDTDIILPNGYFSSLMDVMYDDTSLGIVSGGIYTREVDGELVYEYRHKNNPSGAARLWRKNAFLDTGRFQVTSAPDSVSNAKAILRGYKIMEVSDLKAVQTRKTSSAQGLWKGYVSCGKADYYLGLNPLFAFGKSLKNTIANPPYKGIAYLYGYLKSAMNKAPRTSDEEILKYYSKDKIRSVFKRDGRDGPVFRKDRMDRPLFKGDGKNASAFTRDDYDDSDTRKLDDDASKLDRLPLSKEENLKDG